MAQTTLAPEVRGVTIPLTGCRLLLPNACVSEVITYGPPQLIEDAPDWVLGTINWRGWRAPLVSFAQRAGIAEEEPISAAKVAILKAFSGVHTMPYVGLLAQGFPRLTTVTADDIRVESSAPEGVLYSVVVDNERALVPDLDSIEDVVLPLMRLKA